MIFFPKICDLYLMSLLVLTSYPVYPLKHTPIFFWYVYFPFRVDLLTRPLGRFHWDRLLYYLFHWGSEFTSLLTFIWRAWHWAISLVDRYFWSCWGGFLTCHIRELGFGANANKLLPKLIWTHQLPLRSLLVAKWHEEWINNNYDLHHSSTLALSRGDASNIER